MSLIKTMNTLRQFCNQANTDAPEVVLLFKTRSAVAYFEAALINELSPMQVHLEPHGNRRHIKLAGVNLVIGTVRD